MIDPERFARAVRGAGVDVVIGVPDSLLRHALTSLDAVFGRERHVIAVNEGAAVALAAGHHLATGGLPLVYLQNSGLGNAVNPLLSLADRAVYALPLLLLIGWRGEPGVRDEPQHVAQGRVTPALLTAMDVPHRVLDGDEAAALAALRWAVGKARERSAPAALLVRAGAFAGGAGAATAGALSAAVTEVRTAPPLTRERAIERISGALPAGAAVVASTGMIARELYEHRRRVGQDGAGDFLTVGSMGHASHIALGVALSRPERTVVCLDGDGALLMHMGALAAIGASGVENLLHVVLNNGAHDSVGGQPTVALDVDLAGVARACGYRHAHGGVADEVALEVALGALVAASGARFLEVRVGHGARADLGRPRETPVENKHAFMRRLQGHDDDV